MKTPVTNPIQRFQTQPTRARAVRAKCAECVGCTPTSIEPGFRQTIRDCASNSCPLWQFRPYQAKA